MSLDRRDFVRLMLGTGLGLVAPSKVWPFRKIFLPPAPLWMPSQWITLATPGNFRPGDRVQIYRHVKGLPDYYLVKEVEPLSGIRIVSEFSPGHWVNLDRHEYR